MTNGDRIRQMTDEELAELLGTDAYDFSCNSCPASEICETRDLNCHGSLLYWLKQEVDENG